MTAGRRRLRVPVLLLFALAALLVLAATASAETRAGESTTVLTEGTPSPGATIIKAAASYETSGNVVFNLTMAGASSPNSAGEMYAGLITSQNCAPPSRETLFNEILFQAPPPLAVIQSKMATAGATGLTGRLFEGTAMAATKSVAGTTTTLTGTSSEIANREFNCALIGAGDARELTVEEVGVGDSFVAIPLTVQAEPPPPATTPATSGSSTNSPAPPPPAAATPAPPVLSIAKPSPLRLKIGRWHSVKIKVTNHGPGASAAGSLRLKAPKGVLAKPERQQLPILAPGKSFTLTFRVKLTKKAKKKSTLALTAAASGATSATGSLVLKLKHR